MNKPKPIRSLRRSIVASLFAYALIYEVNADVITVDTSNAANWKQSTFAYFDDTDPNWSGVTTPLPSAATYTLNTAIQPLAAGFTGIFSGSGVTFYRSVVSLPGFTTVTADLSALADNNFQIFVNGISLARYSTDTCGFCGELRLFAGADGSVINGYSGGRPFSNVQSPFPQSIWVSGGNNEIVVAVRNLSGGDIGGFRMNLVLTTTPPPSAFPLPSNAVSWWKAANNANDSVGSSSGTMLNGATFTAGEVGQAFSFDGTDDYVTVPAPFRDFGNQITVEYWINLESAQIGSGLSQGTAGVDSLTTIVWMMHLFPDRSLAWSVNDSGTGRLVQIATALTNGWCHIAGVADTNSTRIYLNGVLANSGPGISSGILSNPSSVIHLGKDVRFATGRFMKGALDEVTMYNRALNASEIQAIYNAGAAGKVIPSPVSLPNNAVSWWKAANNANDSVGSSPGTMLNGATFTAGEVGQAFSFDGTDDYVTVPAPFRDFGKQITVEYWINLESAQIGSGLSQGTAGVDSLTTIVWMMHLFPDRSLAWTVNDSGTGRLAQIAAALTNGWCHIAGVADTNSTRIYLNGVLANSGPGISSGILSNPASVIHLGKDVRFATGRFMKGELDEVTIYDRALTASEIQSIYTAGTAGKFRPPSPDQFVKLDPIVGWPNPAPINDQTPLSCFQLNATNNVPGTFDYGTLLGTKLAAGNHILTAVFTGEKNSDPNVPLDSLYNPAMAFTMLVVTHAANAATVTLNNLAQTYNGQPHPVTATTSPVANLQVDLTYGGGCSAPINAGAYPVRATVSATNYSGFTTNTLIIAKASATVNLSNLTHTYNGQARTASVTTSPPGLLTNITYNGSSSAPVNAGSYTVIATVNHPNYSGSVTGTLTIAKAPATVTLSNLNQVYNGQARPVTATTTPAGLTVNLTYNGSSSAPVITGSYTVAATINDQNYEGSTTGTLTITKAAATVTLGSISQRYNGQSRPATATTFPAGLLVNLTYNGSSFAPTNLGSYTVVGTINDSNYTGSATTTLVIIQGIATVTLGNLRQFSDGDPKYVTATTDPPGLTVNFTYNGSRQAPSNNGTYPVVGSVIEMNYTNSVSGTLTIEEATGNDIAVLVGWGRNYHGQATGITGGTNNTPATAVTVNGEVLSGVKSLAASSGYSVALRRDGTVVAWGETAFNRTIVPLGLSNVTAVAAGPYVAMALKSDTTFAGWGENKYKLLIPPVTNGVTALALGFKHALALKSDGTVVAWGDNSVYKQTNVPAGLTSVQKIAAGGDHSLALKSDGTVVGWGRNNEGQATAPIGLANVADIAAGTLFSVALKTDRTVVAWGYNSEGQTDVPAGLTDVLAIAAGASHAVALKADGTIVGWGRTNEGQLNFPSGTVSTLISAGYDHTLANAPRPLIGSISPSTVQGGTGPANLTIGQNNVYPYRPFTSNSIVRWNNSTLASSTIGDYPVQYDVGFLATVPANFLAVPTSGITNAQITVVNPGNVPSPPKPFTITAANIGPFQSKVATAGQSVVVQTLPTNANTAGLSASFVNKAGSPATVTTAIYSSTPVSGTTINAGGGFVDLQISGADASDSATVQFYYPSTITGTSEAALVLKYYIGSTPYTLLSSGAKAPVKNTTDNLENTVSGGRFTVLFDNTSTPKITELSGTVIALAINQAPAAFADVATASAGTALTVGAPGVLGNDTDPDNDPLQAVLISPASHGQVTMQPDGSFTYTSQADYSGPDSFSYVAHDGNAEFAIATVAINVTPANTPPVIPNQTGAYGAAFSYTIPANAFGDAGTSPTFSLAASGLPPGIALDGAARTLSGTPTAAGVFLSQVTATDNAALPPWSATAPFTFTVTRAPLIVTANDAARDFGAADPPFSGTLVGVLNSDDISATYSTSATESSPAGTYPISPTLLDLQRKLGNYIVTENNGTLTVNPVNTAPLADDQFVSTAEDTAVNITLTGTDLETATTSLNFSVTAPPAHGALSGTAPNLTYTSAANYHGPDSFSFTVTDSGNGSAAALTSAPAVVEITITPVNDAPVARCNDVVVSAGSNCSAQAVVDNGSYDIDEGDTITLTQTPPGPYAVGVTQVTLTMTDNDGASSSCTATVTVIDDTPPTLSVPAPIVVNNDAGNCGAVVNFTVTALDNCSVTVASTPASGSTFPKGATTVTSVATDASGNTTTQTFTVTVNDTEAPSLTVPTPIVVSNTPGSCDAVVSYTVTAADNCPGVTVASTPASGSTFPKGTTTVTSVATDASGNTTTQTFTVTVDDTEAPSLTVPAPIVVNNTPGSCDAVVSYTVTAADNCPGVTVASTPASGSTFPKGTTTVTSVATDASGNTTTQNFTVTVNDTEAPSLAIPAPIVVNNTPGSCDAVVAFTVTAADNCPGVTVASTPASGSTFPKGTTTVTSVATDASGNTTTKTFTVTVMDTEAPSLAVPAPIVVNNTSGSCDAVVSYTVTAADNCPGVTVASTPASGSTFAKGTTTVISVATDASGNTTTKTFTVTVMDTEAPILNCPPNTIVNADDNCQAAIPNVLAGVNVSDNCTPTASITLSQSPASGTLVGLGTYLITVTASDATGNSATCSTTLSVIDTTWPVIDLLTAPNFPLLIGSSVNVGAEFTDNCEPHTAVWEWGDSTSSPGDISEISGSGTVTGSHDYGSAGVYTLRLTVTDQADNSTDATFQYVVIYDPDGGFVTGGGWINSPAGAYTPNLALTGKVTFGFVAKYHHGANVPTGNTEFQFKVANLKFKSTSYEWLVVAGAKAQYKGWGTINGGGSYRFMLTAIDGQANGGGGIDRFRIRIWDAASGGLVYDNQLGAPDNADPTTAIQGGSIVIHKE